MAGDTGGSAVSMNSSRLTGATATSRSACGTADSGESPARSTAAAPSSRVQRALVAGSNRGRSGMKRRRVSANWVSDQSFLTQIIPVSYTHLTLPTSDLV